MPLISTSVWSGARPRSVAGRIASVASLAEGRGKSIDGAMADSAAPSSVVPWRCRLAPLSTSTGDTLSSRLRPSTRVPVTMMSPPSSPVVAASATGAACACSVRACSLGAGGVCAAGATIAAVLSRSSLIMG